MTNVYTVTVISDKEFLSNCRLVAICTDIQVAIDIVESNAMDIHEGTNTYAVIEEVPTNSTYGIPYSSTEFWYEWDTHQYLSVEKPSEFSRLINFWA